MPPDSEGVIKFELRHDSGPLPPDGGLDAIRRWFGICRALDLIGRDPARYEGAAYGNISRRAGTGFLITGTQTGGQETLAPDDIAWVREIDVARNRVVSQGPARPSSESLTHGQVYALAPRAGFVIHVHSPLLWRRAGALGLPATAPEAAYGTPAMAREVERLLGQASGGEAGAFSMGGHEDGIVVFGPSPEQAGLRLLRLYRRACEGRS